MQILTVCTGNICRSPLAEHKLRSDLEPSIFTIESGGVRAVAGGRVPGPQLRIGVQAGLKDLPGHRGRQLTEQMLADADLVLVGTRTHRADVVRMVPSAVSKTFTFREFAHLARTVTGEDIETLVHGGKSLLTAAVVAVAQQRGLAPTLKEYDVVDPYGQDESTYQLAAEQLLPAVEDTAKYLNIVSKLEVASPHR